MTDVDAQVQAEIDAIAARDAEPAPPALSPAELPAELPETPKGFTRRMSTHLNQGSAGKVGIYQVFDPNGHEMPFVFRYHTGDKKGKRGGVQGFVMPGLDVAMTWKQLRNAWRVFVAGVEYARKRGTTP